MPAGAGPQPECAQTFLMHSVGQEIGHGDGLSTFIHANAMPLQGA